MKRLLLSVLVLCPVAAAADVPCWARDYDAAHLAAHPDQRVVSITLGPSTVSGTVDGETVHRLVVRLRGPDTVATATAYCSGTGAMDCGIEGDGGVFTLTPDGASVLLRVGEYGLWLEGAAGAVELSGTSGDDRVFRLDPAVCRLD